MVSFTRTVVHAGRRPITIVILAILVVVAIGAKSRAWRAATSENSARPQQLLPVQPGPAEMVYFTVYDAGIFPREAHASAGAVVLHIEDMSGNSAGLLVSDESLQNVAQVVRRPRRWRDSTRVLLGAGRYTVYDASRPANKATLIVEAQ